jgi:2-(1,2-epoxy-1,2-dihydrophenyl)acetyl-CoA isomerase
METEMSSEPLLFEQTGRVMVITINRPDRRNVLAGDDLFDAFADIPKRLNNDLSIRAAILTGAGKAFCAGGDIKDMRDRKGMFGGTPAEVKSRYSNGIQRIPVALSQLDVPIIAAVNGAAIGAGLDLACMCDIRIAAKSAIFAESFVKLGIISGDGGAWFLPRVIGASRARELAFTGDTIDAAQALALNLVSRTVPDVDLLSEAMALANRIASNPPQVLRWTKRMLREAEAGTMTATLDLASSLQSLAHHTGDHAEAIAAVFEKRPPKFTGA